MSSGDVKRKVRRPLISITREAEPGVVEAPKAVLDERGVNREEREAWRRAMGNEYVYNPRGITLAQLANNPRLGNIPIGTVVQWSRWDNWVELRKAFGERVRRMVETRIANDHVQAQINELRYLIKMHGDLQKKLEVAIADMPLKSCEAAIGAFLKLDERIDERRQQLRAVLVQRNPPEEPGEDAEAAAPTAAQITPRLSDAEVVAAGKAILRERWARPTSEPQAGELPEAVPQRKKRPPPGRGDVGAPPKSEP